MKTKTTEQIKAFIYKKGYKLTNPEMVEKLGVPTMTFAGILAGMKRKGDRLYKRLVCGGLILGCVMLVCWQVCEAVLFY